MARFRPLGRPKADLTAVSAAAAVMPLSTTIDWIRVEIGLTTVDPAWALSTRRLSRPVSVLMPPLATNGPVLSELIVNPPFSLVVVLGSPSSRTPLPLTSINTVAPLTSPSWTTPARPLGSLWPLPPPPPPPPPPPSASPRPTTPKIGSPRPCRDEVMLSGARAGLSESTLADAWA